jgi:L-serine dehydratase
LDERTYFSIGGGFVRDEDEMGQNAPAAPGPEVPFPFASGEELLVQAAAANLTIAELVLANELARQPEAGVLAGLEEIAAAMYACIDRGMRVDGILPGGLKVQRRAYQVHQSLVADADKRIADPLAALDWVNLWALAVNEENAAGGRVVTAPTNGAAGLLPAVLRYYDRFMNGTAAGRQTFLLTAAAIGALYKKNASISGAEVGCQGEVGVACSMAAAGLAAVMGGSNAQIENAAEIAMEHNLGLTCDPIGGLVQIPCIERNAMGAVKAIDAARLALLGDGQHTVSLDKVIATMKRTGEDMSHIYKETSLGGLAVNLAEC